MKPPRDKTEFKLLKYEDQQSYIDTDDKQPIKVFTTVTQAIKYCRREVKRARSNGEFVGYKLIDKFGDTIHSFPSWRF